MTDGSLIPTVAAPAALHRTERRAPPGRRALPRAGRHGEDTWHDADQFMIHFTRPRTSTPARR